MNRQEPHFPDDLARGVDRYAEFARLYPVDSDRLRHHATDGRAKVAGAGLVRRDVLMEGPTPVRIAVLHRGIRRPDGRRLDAPKCQNVSRGGWQPDYRVGGNRVAAAIRNGELTDAVCETARFFHSKLRQTESGTL